MLLFHHTATAIYIKPLVHKHGHVWLADSFQYFWLRACVCSTCIFSKNDNIATCLGCFSWPLYCSKASNLVAGHVIRPSLKETIHLDNQTIKAWFPFNRKCPRQCPRTKLFVPASGAVCDSLSAVPEGMNWFQRCPRQKKHSSAVICDTPGTFYCTH